MEYKVFIGYSKEDEKYAESLRQSLGKIIELIPYKAEVYKQFGEDFKNRLRNEIASSQFMVVLLTENGKNAQWVNQEIGFAQGINFLHKEATPHIIPISNRDSQLKGFITKDSMDFLILEDFASFDLIIANVIGSIRHSIPNGLKDGTLHLRITCPACFDKDDLPYEWKGELPDYESMIRALKSNKPIMGYRCPKCNKDNLIEITTLLPQKSL
jgi:hypothetical protein